MSAIDDLKNGIEIDATGSERVDISSSAKQAMTINTMGNHYTKSTTVSTDRIEADLSGLPKSELEQQAEKDIHESLAKDILEGENSPFAKYVQQKTAEMEERMAEYEQEQELDEELDDDEESSYTDSYNGGLFDADVNYKDEDDVEEEEVNMSIIEENIEVETEDETEKENDDFSANDNASVEENKVEKNKEERIENPDIDVTVDSELSEIDEVIEEEESTSDAERDEVLKHLKNLVTDKLKPVSKSLDISSFTVLKKATANTKSILNNTTQVKVAKWVLFNQESIVLMKEFSGSELETLRELSEDNSSLTMISKKYKMIYDHIVSPKPSSFEVWLKSTPYSDNDHYFFAIYISSFKGANFLPMDCKVPNCKETFITEDTPIMDMVRFMNEDAKKLFTRVYQSEVNNNNKGIYCTEIVPLSSKVAVGFKEPSLYNLLELASLDQRFKDEHSSIIEILPYIDTMYLIDAENEALVPVGYKTYPENATKTVKSKVKQFERVIKTLTVDEFGPIKAYIRAIEEHKIGVRYLYPSVECPKCGTSVAEIVTTAEELVFTRYQLGALVNTSLN